MLKEIKITPKDIEAACPNNCEFCNCICKALSRELGGVWCFKKTYATDGTRRVTLPKEAMLLLERVQKYRGGYTTSFHVVVPEKKIA